MNTYAYVSGNPINAIDPLGLFQATPGTPLYEALVRAGAIAAADGPEPYYADVAAIAYLGGFTLAMGIDLLLNDDYADVVEQSDFDFIVSEIQLYKPTYTYDTSTLWSPNWEDYFDLLNELYETQLGYVETAENSICAPEYAPYSEELLERARSGIEFTSGIDGILNQNDDLIDQQLENAYEDYRAEGGDLTYEDWVAQGMPEAGDVSNSIFDFSQISQTISTQRQYRHIKDRPEWINRGQGGYLNSVEDAQAVLTAAHEGRVEFLGTTPQGFPVVRYEGVTGYNNNPGAGFIDQPTNVFIIKGTARPSVVPTTPNWGQ